MVTIFKPPTGISPLQLPIKPLGKVIPVTFNSAVPGLPMLSVRCAELPVTMLPKAKSPESEIPGTEVVTALKVTCTDLFAVTLVRV